MADFTSRAIKETFIKQLEERPISEITVKSIVEECGVNRNSFYYHFRDLPALVEEIVKEEAEGIIAKYPSVNSILECYDALIEFASHRKKAIMHIFQSLNREVFERNLMWVSEYFIKSWVENVSREKKLSDRDREALVNYYKCLGFGMVIDWLNHGMSETYTADIRRVLLYKMDFIQESILMFDENHKE